MDGGGDFFPGGDLGRVPDPGDVGVAACAFGYEGGLCDDQGTRDRCALRVVLLGEGQQDVVVVCPKASQGGHHQAMLEVHVPNPEGFEDSGARHGGSWSAGSSDCLTWATGLIYSVRWLR